MHIFGCCYCFEGESGERKHADCLSVYNIMTFLFIYLFIGGGGCFGFVCVLCVCGGGGGCCVTLSQSGSIQLVFPPTRDERASQSPAYPAYLDVSFPSRAHRAWGGQRPRGTQGAVEAPNSIILRIVTLTPDRLNRT